MVARAFLGFFITVLALLTGCAAQPQYEAPAHRPSMQQGPVRMAPAASQPQEEFVSGDRSALEPAGAFQYSEQEIAKRDDPNCKLVLNKMEDGRMHRQYRCKRLVKRAVR